MTAIRTGLLAAALAAPVLSAPASAQFLTPIGSYGAGVFDDSAAEIPAYDPVSQRLFVVNATVGVDVLDLSDPTLPTKITTIAAPGANSVDVSGGVLAIAQAAAVETDPGSVLFYDAAGNFGGTLATATVGALPDMLTFTPDGSRVLVANEGEPNSYGMVDSVNPEGSVSIIDLNLAAGPSLTPVVTTAGFTGLNAFANNIDPEVRVFGPGATVAQDLEPEYIAVNDAGTTAYVGLQEANAVAVLDIPSATITEVRSLGFKDHSLPGNELDASNRDAPGASNDGIINIRNWPVFGMYQPDAITTYEVGGNTYLLTANEGDARSSDDFPGFNEEVRGDDLALDPTVFPDAATLQDDDNLGRLRVTNALGDTDGDGDFDEIYAFGARSFSVFDITTGTPTLVFDSGSEFEVVTANVLPANFNAQNDENDFDSRSDDKGPEPEAIIVGNVDGTDYAFIGLERVGGVMVYDLTDPTAPVFVEYVNPRDFSGDLEAAVLAANGTALSNFGSADSGPEGFAFIAAADSPNGQPLLVVANEVSGTTTVYQVPEPALALPAVAGLALLRRRRA